MTNERQGNIAASVRQQLLDLSRERGEDFQLILTWYAAERFLYRLALSKYSKQFILKGAMLLNIWMDWIDRFPDAPSQNKLKKVSR